jgi:hypothetical protein
MVAFSSKGRGKGERVVGVSTIGPSGEKNQNPCLFHPLFFLAPRSRSVKDVVGRWASAMPDDDGKHTIEGFGEANLKLRSRRSDLGEILDLSRYPSPTKQELFPLPHSLSPLPREL